MKSDDPEYAQVRKTSARSRKLETRTEQIRGFENVSATLHADGTVTLMSGRLNVASGRMVFTALGELCSGQTAPTKLVAGLIDAAYQLSDSYEDQPELPF